MKKTILFVFAFLLAAALYGQDELFLFISELADNFPAKEEQAIEQFKTHDFFPDSDGTYVRLYDNFKAVVYEKYQENSPEDNIIIFALGFNNDVAFITALQNLSTYLSGKYYQRTYYDKTDQSYSSAYFGSSIIQVMDGKKLYSDHSILITIGL
jgi:hypothetical protein